MRKKHVILLIIAFIMCGFSAYSLAAINSTYSINFEWFSGYNKEFSSEVRPSNYDWEYLSYPKSIFFDVINSNNESIYNTPEYKAYLPKKYDSSTYIYLIAGIRNVSSPAVKLQLIEISQKGNTIECKANIMGEKNDSSFKDENNTFSVVDIVRIPKKTLLFNGKIVVILKNQFGVEISKIYYKE